MATIIHLFRHPATSRRLPPSPQRGKEIVPSFFLSPFSLLLFSFLLSSLCLLPNTLFAQKQQKISTQTEVFTKNFKVKSKDILDVNTNYTKITFEEWDKNEIDFTTTVTVKNATEKVMEQVLNGLNITTKQSGKKVSYSLTFNYSNDRNRQNTVEGLEINLLVKIPKDIFLEVTSRYGSVVLADAHNDFDVNIMYGNLNAGNLFGNNNKIDIRYGNLKIDNLFGNNKITLKYGNFNIKHAERLSFDVMYSTGNLNEVGTLNLDSKYCTIKLDKVKVFTLTSGYDKISIQNSVDNLKGEMRYGTFTMGSLKYSFIIDLSYSNVTIGEVLISFTNISIVSHHSNVRLNIPQNQSFAFDYSGRYTDFKDKNVKWNHTTFEAGNNSLQMSGFFGNNQNSGKSVKIRATYGSVALF
ncbi:MAG: hypothetical protein FWC34_06070 [Bacteroidetes bacterium]|nr:hypothetical protein [Bacteroidota bacterium]MCL2302960.1 hypothetical protein [Lentimicrobiaceae bacterium]